MVKTGIGMAVVTAALISLWVGGCGEATKAGKAVRSKKDYPIEPVSFTDVKFTDEFWRPKLEINREVTIPHILKACEATGRVDNFAIAGGLMKGQQKGHFPFDDSDVYKIIEAASYSLSVQPDKKLEKHLDELIAKIAAAQDKDGYLYTARTNKSKRLANWFGPRRWSRLDRSHELYNMGHLYEAAAAHYKATGKRTLLNVAIKNADLLDNTFGPGKLTKWPGHQEIEIGLVKLYRVTGNKKYLNLAKFFLDTRGPNGGEYAQAHKKPYNQTEAVGHAVRATYMYCGMTDVAALTGDRRYADAVEKIWQNVVGKKMYLTGGIGSKGDGEAFGKNYELPNASAYCETCAAVGNALWNYRMFLLTGQAKYLDVFERVLYNGLISGVSLSGDRFFYPNPLESDGRDKRVPWFSCACCPGNLARFMAMLPGFAYAKSGDTLYVNMFAAGKATVKLKGNTVRMTQETWYPWDGAVKMTVEPAKAGKFNIAVRIPGWAKGSPVPGDLYRYIDGDVSPVEFRVNGEVVQPDVKNGFALFERRWNKLDVIEMQIPMSVRRVAANSNVDADRGKIAIERGPVVYCAEWPDNDVNVLELTLADDAVLWTDRFRNLLNDVVVVRSRVDSAGSEHEFIAVPYYAWANRGKGPMEVWLKTESPD